MRQRAIARKHLSSVLLLILCAPAVGFANEDAEAAAGEHEHESGEHEFHRNWLAGFVGVTSEERREGGLAFGIEYARRFTPTFSIGLLAERTLGDLDFWVFAAPLGYTAGQWKFYAGPGVEREDKGENEFLVRVGVEYVFEVNEWEISPQFDIDFVDGDQARVLGVTIGKSY